MVYFGKKSTWLQILFWGGLWILIPLVVRGGDLHARDVGRNLFVFTAIAVLIFVNLEILLPKLYFKKRQAFYILGAIALLVLIVFLQEWDGAPWAEYFNSPFKKRGPRFQSRSPWQTRKIIGAAMPYFTSLLGSAFFEMARFANLKEKEAVGLRNERLEAEMKFLKSQINPHFLFNALNNIYTLSLIKSDDAPENLLKLSNMLRYMLYDCKADKVPLQKELEYIRNYIDLNMLKDSRGLNVEVDLDESRPNLMIAPLLFVPLIENAFKHSKVEDLKKGWIKINLETGDGTVIFQVSNSIPEANFTKDEAGGIGLVNVKRQLELIYPDKHEIDIDKSDTQFDVYLKIALS